MSTRCSTTYLAGATALVGSVGGHDQPSAHLCEPRAAEAAGEVAAGGALHRHVGSVSLRRVFGDNLKIAPDRVLPVGDIGVAMLLNARGEEDAADALWPEAHGIALSPCVEVVLPPMPDDDAQVLVLANHVPLGRVVGGPTETSLQLPLPPEAWTLSDGPVSFAVETIVEVWQEPAPAVAAATPLSAPVRAHLRFRDPALWDDWVARVARIVSLRHRLREVATGVRDVNDWVEARRLEGTMPSALGAGNTPQGAPQFLALTPQALAWATSCPLEVPLRWLTPPLLEQLQALAARRAEIPCLRAALERELYTAWMVGCAAGLCRDATEGTHVSATVTDAESRFLAHLLTAGERFALLEVERPHFWTAASPP